MQNTNIIILAGAVIFFVFLLVKLAGYRLFGKLFTLALLSISILWYNRTSLPVKNLNNYVSRCAYAYGPHYSLYHLASKRMVFVYVNNNRKDNQAEACILADNGQTSVINWYSMSRRNNVDLADNNSSDDKIIEMFKNSKSKISINGNYGVYYVMSPTTLPFFRADITAYKDNQGRLTLKEGYTDDRTVFVRRF